MSVSDAFVLFVDEVREFDRQAIVASLPAGVLYHPVADDLAPRRRVGTGASAYIQREDLENFSLYAAVLAGMRFELGPYHDIEVTAGPGLLHNPAFTIPFIQADVIVALWEAASIHGGPLLLHPVWTGESEVDLSPGPGFLLGAMLDHEYLLLSADLFWGRMDAHGREGWTTRQDTLDLTGFMARFGMGF